VVNEVSERLMKQDTGVRKKAADAPGTAERTFLYQGSERLVFALSEDLPKRGIKTEEIEEERGTEMKFFIHIPGNRRSCCVI